MIEDFDVELTSGSLTSIFKSQKGLGEHLWTAEHTLQVASIKRITNPGRVERYRLIVSDGSHYTQAMLATGLNFMVTEGRLKPFDVVKVEKVICVAVQDKKLIILLALGVVKHCDQRLGDPQMLNPQANTDSNTLPHSRSTDQTPAQSNGPVAYPIKDLSYYSAKWTIKARVTRKSSIKEYLNAKKEGRYFNAILMDSSGEIRVTSFNRCVTEFYDRLQEGKLYYISKARVNPANKKFSPLNHKYELALEINSMVIECTDPNEMPVMKYNFVELAALGSVQKGSVCDVLAVVKNASQCQEITTKDRNRVTKRDIFLVDRSGILTQLTLWGQQAEQFIEIPKAVVAFKGVKVGDFGGRPSLSMVVSSIRTPNPNIPEAHALRKWIDAGGLQRTYKSSSSSAGIPSGSSGSATLRREELLTLEDAVNGTPKKNFREESYRIIDFLRNLHVG